MRTNKMMKRAAVTLMAALMATGIFAVANPVTVSANDGLGIYKEEGLSVKDMDQYAVITASSANIREGVSTSERVVNTASKGTVLKITGRVYRDGQATEWYRVYTKDKDYGGETAAYIHSSTFQFKEEANSKKITKH